jgi:hypothetical protein
MKNYYLFIALVISFLGHLFFLNNINFSFNKLTSEESLFIEMIPIPSKSSINEIKKIHKIKKNIQQIKNKKNKATGLLSIDKQRGNREKLIKNEICDLCQPVEEINIPDEEMAYGKEIKSIKMQYIVFHTLAPNKGNINNFRLFGGRKDAPIISHKSEVGILNIEYSIDKNRYTIIYEAKANGITSLVYSKSLVQKSEGIINKDGIQPNYYLYKYGDKLKNEAFFDWKDNKLEIIRQNKKKFFDLVEGTQDQLSFMFQFMFLNPLNKMQIPITNAKIFKTYDYQYIKEGEMKSKIGDINYIHVAKFNYQDPERIDLWLAKDYGFLPFKVSITDEDLSTTTQEIYKIQVEKND